ncbi:3-alpha,7-alpha,12-alpha-trihydroxy-5-beta-cholest-24-enoyl-CoA hydratase [Azospirillum doebereinerae]|uniref:MaoC/PaaZ C-terminal domain-containing protein n=1 Tax=Azospirillum doebereinerae TaxID=92933 RepID=UPI001EE52766|nr:MaoC/PaaZ C-terminal domain-containing protein [Azospirillum doebereinerae]MCG5242210.1 3-alpha,7-alpha,12-alpha-trihydroxy-5-beta-cholest-24-enoyl-CoA hydratase [Azospirillum doebereinerae]
MLDHAAILALRTRDETSWTERDVMLYALGVGMGTDPMDGRELPFVYERGLKVLPTFPIVPSFAGGPLFQIGIDTRYLLHGEQAVTLHKPIPIRGRAVVEGRMLGAWDKGAGKGAVFAQEKILRLVGDPDPLATVVTTAFGRAEGGFGGPTTGQPAPHRVPERAPDRSLAIPTTPSQALLYRQSGDLNPLHADPEAARVAGYPRPILHGLCTYAIAARAVLAACCAYEPERIVHHQARFSAPVYPGETITVDLWIEADQVAFEARVEARDNLVVVKNGLTRLSGAFPQ